MGSQKGDVFDYITNLLENFENVDMTNPRDQILSPGSETNDDLFYPVINYIILSKLTLLEPIYISYVG